MYQHNIYVAVVFTVLAQLIICGVSSARGMGDVEFEYQEIHEGLESIYIKLPDDKEASFEEVYKSLDKVLLKEVFTDAKPEKIVDWVMEWRPEQGRLPESLGVPNSVDSVKSACLLHYCQAQPDQWEQILARIVFSKDEAAGLLLASALLDDDLFADHSYEIYRYKIYGLRSMFRQYLKKKWFIAREKNKTTASRLLELSSQITKAYEAAGNATNSEWDRHCLAAEWWELNQYNYFDADSKLIRSWEIKPPLRQEDREAQAFAAIEKAVVDGLLGAPEPITNGIRVEITEAAAKNLAHLFVGTAYKMYGGTVLSAWSEDVVAEELQVYCHDGLPWDFVNNPEQFAQSIKWSAWSGGYRPVPNKIQKQILRDQMTEISDAFRDTYRDKVPDESIKKLTSIWEEATLKAINCRFITYSYRPFYRWQIDRIIRFIVKDAGPLRVMYMIPKVDGVEFDEKCFIKYVASSAISFLAAEQARPSSGSYPESIAFAETSYVNTSFVCIYVPTAFNDRSIFPAKKAAYRRFKD